MTGALLATLPLPWPFDREYMQLALGAAVVVGVCAPLIGVFLVQKKMALMGDGVGHLAFAGVAAGLLLEVAPLWSALVVAVIGALAIDWLQRRGRATGDLALALVFYGGIALGVVLVSRSGAGSLSIVQYLFGSILTVTPQDLGLIAGLGIVIVAMLAVFGRPLFAAVLDEDAARVAGLPVDATSALLSVLTAVTVVAAMRVVGVLLVAALMVLPVASSRLLARSFRGTLVISVLVGVLSAVVGLAGARAWGSAPGGTIVLAATACFGIVAVVTTATGDAGRRRRTPPDMLIADQSPGGLTPRGQQTGRTEG